MPSGLLFLAVFRYHSAKIQTVNLCAWCLFPFYQSVKTVEYHCLGPFFLTIFLAQNKMNGPGMLAPVYFASLGLEKETCCLQTLYQSFRQLHLHPFCIHCSIKEKKVQSTAVFQSDLYSLTMKVFVFLQKKILHLCLLLSFICYSEQCLSHYSSPGMNTNIPGRNEDFATNLFNFILSAFLHQPLSLSDW